MKNMRIEWIFTRLITKLFEEGLKLHKVNRLIFTKLNMLELKNESLITKIEESTI